MNTPLPTAEELEKLPLRAVVAYAARTARRVSSELRGIVADEILNDALRLVDAVSTTHLIGKIDPASVIRASERVTAAYEAAPDNMKSVEKFRLVFSLAFAALTAMNALLAADDPTIARDQMKRAAQDAERAVRPIRCLSRRAARAATEAARKDYDILLRKYGKHEEVIIGDPVDCFPKGEKGGEKGKRGHGEKGT